MAIGGPNVTTIDEALDAFLAEQDKRLAERTYRNYLEVVELFRDCMNGYGYESLSELERRRWQAAFDAGDERAFTRLFGAEKIPEQVGQFLGWFVIRKVMAGQEFLKACGTVTKKLGKWLAANSYIDANNAADMAERGSDAGDELPKAEKLAGLLYEQTRSVTGVRQRLDPRRRVDRGPALDRARRARRALVRRRRRSGEGAEEGERSGPAGLGGHPHAGQGGRRMADRRGRQRLPVTVTRRPRSPDSRGRGRTASATA